MKCKEVKVKKDWSKPKLIKMKRPEYDETLGSSSHGSS